MDNENYNEIVSDRYTEIKRKNVDRKSLIKIMKQDVQSVEAVMKVCETAAGMGLDPMTSTAGLSLTLANISAAAERMNDLIGTSDHPETPLGDFQEPSAGTIVVDITAGRTNTREGELWKPEPGEPSGPLGLPEAPTDGPVMEGQSLYDEVKTVPKLPEEKAADGPESRLVEVAPGVMKPVRSKNAKPKAKSMEERAEGVKCPVDGIPSAGAGYSKSLPEPDGDGMKAVPKIPEASPESQGVIADESESLTAEDLPKAFESAATYKPEEHEEPPKQTGSMGGVLPLFEKKDRPSCVYTPAFECRQVMKTAKKCADGCSHLPENPKGQVCRFNLDMDNYKCNKVECGVECVMRYDVGDSGEKNEAERKADFEAIKSGEEKPKKARAKKTPAPEGNVKEIMEKVPKPKKAKKDE